MNDLPRRKPTRLQGFNYGEGNSFFLTICTQDRQQLLGEIVGGGVLDAPHVQLSEYGLIVDQTIRAMDETYADLSVECYIIMPDHLHLLVTVTGVPGAKIIHQKSADF